jgi:hypothetical protein
MKQIGFTIYNPSFDAADRSGLEYEILDGEGKIKETDFVKSSRVVTIQPGEELRIREAVRT